MQDTHGNNLTDILNPFLLIIYNNIKHDTDINVIVSIYSRIYEPNPNHLEGSAIALEGLHQTSASLCFIERVKFQLFEMYELKPSQA